ncbi:MAG: glutaredoxin domain-containing protein [Candidatus Paceibacterota bacterium]|jgi:glutaredoxin-like YruB-family protein
MQVKVYSTPICPMCQVAKDFLKANNVAFEEIDVSQDEKLAQEMILKSGQTGVPVIDIDGKIVTGFNKPLIEEILGLNNNEGEQK